MGSQEFLTIYIAVGVFFAVWYIISRAKIRKEPSKLNLKAGDSDMMILPPESRENPTSREAMQSEKNFDKDFYKMRYSNRGIPPKPVRDGEKDLNVIFNYNGHSWDAYEVLGVPAGSRLPDITSAYQKMLKDTDKESHTFLETAYQAILNKNKF